MMETYKQKLYNAYVSSGQVGVQNTTDSNLFFSNKRFHIEGIIETHFKNSSKSETIIDVGCGHGAFIYFLKKHQFTNLYGFDISKEQIELGHKLGIKDIENKSIEEFLDTDINNVHTFLLIDIIEHLTIEEVFHLLEQLYLKLKEGGKLIIHVPNAEGIYGMRIRHGDLTHELAFTPKSMRQLLFTLGFKQVNCFEDKPVVHGLKSLLRRLIWEFLSLFHRLLLIAETGETKFILSQNMLVVAKK